MARKIKCKICELESNTDDTNMTFVMNGKTRAYVCIEHKDVYVKQEEKKKIEREKWDNLYKTIQNIHGIIKLPTTLITKLQDLKNGTNRFEKDWKKGHYKSIDYDVLERAYKLSEDSIKWAKLNKHFKDSNAELNYGLAIVQGKINDVYRQVERERLTKVREVAMADKKAEQYKESQRKVEYKPKKAKYDLSDFLD
jgi:hypothetical protein